MFIPIQSKIANYQNKMESVSDVYLEAGHIIIKNLLAQKIFGEETVVLSIYYNKENSFMVAPASEEFFRKMHKANQQMLKLKNANGDRSLPVQDILLDNNLNENDRDLKFTKEETLHILKINF